MFSSSKKLLCQIRKSVTQKRKSNANEVLELTGVGVITNSDTHRTDNETGSDVNSNTNATSNHGGDTIGSDANINTLVQMSSLYNTSDAGTPEFFPTPSFGTNKSPVPHYGEEEQPQQQRRKYHGAMHAIATDLNYSFPLMDSHEYREKGGDEGLEEEIRKRIRCTPEDPLNGTCAQRSHIGEEPVYTKNAKRFGLTGERFETSVRYKWNPINEDCVAEDDSRLLGRSSSSGEDPVISSRIAGENLATGTSGEDPKRPGSSKDLAGFPESLSTRCIRDGTTSRNGTLGGGCINATSPLPIPCEKEKFRKVSISPVTKERVFPIDTIMSVRSISDKHVRILYELLHTCPDITTAGPRLPREAHNALFAPPSTAATNGDDNGSRIGHSIQACSDLQEGSFHLDRAGSRASGVGKNDVEKRGDKKSNGKYKDQDQDAENKENDVRDNDVKGDGNLNADEGNLNESKNPNPTAGSTDHQMGDANEIRGPKDDKANKKGDQVDDQKDKKRKKEEPGSSDTDDSKKLQFAKIVHCLGGVPVLPKTEENELDMVQLRDRFLSRLREKFGDLDEKLHLQRERKILEKLRRQRERQQRQMERLQQRQMEKLIPEQQEHLAFEMQQIQMQQQQQRQHIQVQQLQHQIDQNYQMGQQQQQMILPSMPNQQIETQNQQDRSPLSGHGVFKSPVSGAGVQMSCVTSSWTMSNPLGPRMFGTMSGHQTRGIPPGSSSVGVGGNAMHSEAMRSNAFGLNAMGSHATGSLLASNHPHWGSHCLQGASIFNPPDLMVDENGIPRGRIITREYSQRMNEDLQRMNSHSVLKGRMLSMNVIPVDSMNAMNGVDCSMNVMNPMMDYSMNQNPVDSSPRGNAAYTPRVDCDPRGPGDEGYGPRNDGNAYSRRGETPRADDVFKAVSTPRNVKADPNTPRDCPTFYDKSPRDHSQLHYSRRDQGYTPRDNLHGQDGYTPRDVNGQQRHTQPREHSSVLSVVPSVVPTVTDIGAVNKNRTASQIVPGAEKREQQSTPYVSGDVGANPDPQFASTTIPSHDVNSNSQHDRGGSLNLFESDHVAAFSTRIAGLGHEEIQHFDNMQRPGSVFAPEMQPPGSVNYPIATPPALLRANSMGGPNRVGDRTLPLNHNTLMRANSVSGAPTPPLNHNTLMRANSVSGAPTPPLRHHTLMREKSVSGAPTPPLRHNTLMRANSVGGVPTPPLNHNTLVRAKSTGGVPTPPLIHNTLMRANSMGGVSLNAISLHGASLVKGNTNSGGTPTSLGGLGTNGGAITQMSSDVSGAGWIARMNTDVSGAGWIARMNSGVSGASRLPRTNSGTGGFPRMISGVSIGFCSAGPGSVGSTSAAHPNAVQRKTGDALMIAKLLIVMEFWLFGHPLAPPYCLVPPDSRKKFCSSFEGRILRHAATIAIKKAEMSSANLPTFLNGRWVTRGRISDADEARVAIAEAHKRLEEKKEDEKQEPREATLEDGKQESREAQLEDRKQEPREAKREDPNQSFDVKSKPLAIENGNRQLGNEALPIENGGQNENGAIENARQNDDPNENTNPIANTKQPDALNDNRDANSVSESFTRSNERLEENHRHFNAKLVEGQQRNNSKKDTMRNPKDTIPNPTSANPKDPHNQNPKNTSARDTNPNLRDTNPKHANPRLGPCRPQLLSELLDLQLTGCDVPWYIRFSVGWVEFLENFRRYEEQLYKLIDRYDGDAEVLDKICLEYGI